MNESSETLEQRNARVDTDKAWETSWTRKLVIALLTYVIIGSYLTALNIQDAWLHAIVPATAYLVSTLGLRYIKLIWINVVYNKSKGVSK